MAAMDKLERSFQALIDRIRELPGVQSIGRTGSARKLPASPADGDIDVFVYCYAVPPEETRRAAILNAGDGVECGTVGAISGGRWGTGDVAHIRGIETWLMYMTAEEAAAEAESILSGREPDKQNNYFYPTGRLGMLQGMEVLHDGTGFLRGLRERLAKYPEELASKLISHHLDKLDDTEDLKRAVARGDALFFHFALDLALDHFLQALFALNRVYFPSRKRSLEHMRGFARKPCRCEERLLEILRLGGSPEGLERSFTLWNEQVDELREIWQGLERQ